MLKKILIALDGSELAERALTFATALSIPTAARLVLVRVVTAHTFPGVDEREPQVRALAEAEIYVRAIAADLVSRGFVVEAATPYGETPAEWIVEEAKTRNADLIVMSTHGRTGPGRWMFGSVADAVVARSPVPVLVQRAWDTSRRELLLGDQPRVLVPLDGSAFAAAALPTAASLADDLGAELVLVRVDTTPYDVKAGDAQEARPVSEVQLYLRDMSQRLKDRWPNLSVSWLVESGDPADGIAAATADRNAALVVMATHGRTGLPRSALGSVAGRVLQHGNAPLMLVHPKAVTDEAHPTGWDGTTRPSVASS